MVPPLFLFRSVVLQIGVQSNSAIQKLLFESYHQKRIIFICIIAGNTGDNFLAGTPISTSFLLNPRFSHSNNEQWR